MRWSFFLVLSACIGGTEVKVGSYNSEPSATILYPAGGAPFNEGEVIQFEAKISDSYDSPENLEFYWTSDIQGELASYSPSMETPPVVPSPDGFLAQQI